MNRDTIVGLIARQSVTNAIYTYAGMGLGALLTLFLYPRILTPDAYGLTRVLVSAGMMGAHLSHLGIRNTILRFTPVCEGDPERLRSFRSYTYLLPLAGFLLYILLFWVLQDRIVHLYQDRSPLVGDYIHLLVPLTLAILYFEIANSTLRSLNDSTSGSFAQDILLRLLLIGSLLLLWLDWIELDHFFWLFVLAYGLLPVRLARRLYTKGAMQWTLKFDRLSKMLRRAMIRYGVYTMLGGLTTVVVWNIDILMLGSLAGLDQTAVYAIAFYMGSVITVPQRSLEKILTPRMAKEIRLRNFERIGQLYRQSAHVQSLSGAGLLFVVWILSGPVLLLLPEIYREGALVILIIGWGKWLDISSGANGSILLLSRHYRWDLLFNGILVLLTFTTNWILIPKFGVTGAAMATALSLLFYNTCKVLFIRSRFGLLPFARTHLYLLLWTGLTTLAMLYFRTGEPVADLIRNTLLFLVLWVLPMGLQGELSHWKTLMASLRQRESE